MKNFFQTNLFWRLLLDLWTSVAVLVSALDFLAKNKYNSATVVVGAIYIALLGIYVADKEIERWTHKTFASKFFGEIYIIIWTALTLLLLCIQLLSGSEFHLNSDMAAIYISVIGIFAITQKSKNIYKSRKQKS